MKTDDEDLWLKEMVDDDLLGLFGDEAGEVRKTAARILARAGRDPAILESLVGALRTSLERQNDDTQATLWIALLLGEIGDPGALPVLFLGLGSEDETVQEACRDAILRMGPPAIDPLLDEIDQEPGPEMVDAAYRLLGYVGSLGDAGLRERVMDFLADRVDREAAKPAGETRIESLFQASALLGDRRMLEAMDRVLRTRFGGKNPAIQDSREMLAENASGEPLVFDSPPWIEEHRWLFEEDLGAARVSGRRPAEPEEGEGGAGGDEVDPAEKALSSLYWGLGGTGAAGDEDVLDARRFLDHPGGEEGDEEGEGAGGCGSDDCDCRDEEEPENEDDEGAR